jgi:hypothetical protein
MLVYCEPRSEWASRPSGASEAVGHLERVEHELGAHVRGELPADDHPRVAVEHEGQIEEPFQVRR